jgi:molybdate transport system substrate-binding protein
LIAIRKAGDVFIPGAAKYVKDAVKQGLVQAEGQRSVCYHVPVILVPAGNPANIKSLQDLARPDVRVALADAKAAAIGKVANALLKKNGLQEQVAKNVAVRPSTTNQLLIYAATGQVDACIAWEDQATWGQAKGKVAIVHIPSSQNTLKTIPAAMVTYSKQTETAQDFINYIASPEGKALWQKWGFPIEKPE